MAELVQEFDDAQVLAGMEAKKLLEEDPTHELLKYFVIGDEDMTDGKPDPAKHSARKTEMKNRFWDRCDPWQQAPTMEVMCVVLMNYYRTVKEVNDARARASKS